MESVRLPRVYYQTLVPVFLTDGEDLDATAQLLPKTHQVQLGEPQDKTTRLRLRPTQLLVPIGLHRVVDLVRLLDVLRCPVDLLEDHPAAPLRSPGAP